MTFVAVLLLANTVVLIISAVLLRLNWTMTRRWFALNALLETICADAFAMRHVASLERLTDKPIEVQVRVGGITAKRRMLRP